MIIIGYQGIGKSTLCGNNSSYIDLESGSFYYEHDDGVMSRDPSWYKVYVNVAMDLSEQGYDVFVSSHEVVRKELLARNAPVCAVVPDVSLKSEWIAKLEERYNNTKLEKDYKAWKNAEDRFEANIAEIALDIPNTVKLKQMNYDLLFAIICCRCNIN